MASDFGTGVSRVLDPLQASWTQVIWQQGKPPLDSELNLNQQLAADWRRILTLRGTPSGWLGNAVNPSEVFVTSAMWSNWFRFGQQRSGEKRAIPWAVVNGWVVPVTGTLTGTPPGSPNDSDTWNRITLDPAPSNSGNSRIDFAFLEVWLARVPPNPSTSHKPGASTVYRYGNVEGGYTYLADDIQDPAIGFETTQRVQLQYRIRVVSGLVGLTTYPDGFDPTVVKAQGAAAATTSYVFENMREELGDPGLWRAGDGTSNSLGTVDGYSYAVPICAIFRRNSVSWDGDPGQNLNGGFDRNPTAVDRTGYKTFSTTPSLGADLTDSALTLTLASASNIPLPVTPATAVTIQIGDEIMTYSAISGTTMTLVDRGALGSKPEQHFSGDTITVVSGRPDGLFADQIAKTDILDLRHVVNPNGFDYDSLLQQNLDKLLRGQLRATWKRSGGGPQGGFVFYQDKISNSAAAIGVTKLDGPDNVRKIFSDAAVQQPIEFIAQPPSVTGPAVDISTTWTLGLNGTIDNTIGGAGGFFSPDDVITIPVAQLKTGIPGGDIDQIRFIGSGDGDDSVVIRIDGQAQNLKEGYHFSVNSPTSSDDLEITLLADFPTTDRSLYMTLNVLYGPGRGLSRRPDSIHGISFLSTSTGVMNQLSGIPANNIPMRTAWALLWSQFRSESLRGLIPVTAEAYADPGSKTIVLQPYREIELPTEIQVLDGSAVNMNDTTAVLFRTTGDTNAGSPTITDGGANFHTLGLQGGSAADGWKDAVVVYSGTMAGTYWIVDGSVAASTLDVDRNFPFSTGSLSYYIYHTQGLMPLDDREGNSKWLTTDPLDLFSGETEDGVGNPSPTKNLYVPVPRMLMPGWGEIRVPIMHSDPTTTPPGGTSAFDQGINFGIMAKKGAKASRPESESNYTSLENGTISWAPFSTWDWSIPAPATYNEKFISGVSFAGMRFFTDTRGLGRKGLELPPFYGVARLFAVYSADDYGDTPGTGLSNGTAFNDDTREPTGGGATNLLRQDFDGPTMWIEVDEDGDPTFILNADAIDIAKAPIPIADFESGHYVIEASIFGIDRDSFVIDAPGYGSDNTSYINDDARLVLARARTQAISGTRTANFGTADTAKVDSPDLIAPAPLPAADEVAINYSRSPYQGDAWGSQSNQQDIPHKQGPLTAGTIYQLTSTELDEQNLTRPNQKALEVLSRAGFMTTLGSGRLAGDLTTVKFDPRTVGYEVQSNWPPSSGSDPRPSIALQALAPYEETLILGTEYHNCIERLPLGAFFRDKDFRGNFINGETTAYRPSVRAPLVFTNSYAPGIAATGVGLSSNIEQSEVGVNTSSLASGQPGEMVAHVDGESGNYGLLTNFRTNRGGSVFTLSGLRPGGEASATFQTAGPSNTYPAVLSGTAYLVRNTVTSIGSSEVSAGGELMMVIVTHGQRLDTSEPTSLEILSGTNGTGEGFSAVDLYHIEGKPLAVDNVRVEVDPSTITLSKKVPLLG